MSTAAAAEAPAPAKGKKKLIIIVAAAAVLVLGGGGVAMMMMKKSAAAADEAGDAEGGKKPAPVKAAVKFDPKMAPTFVPLDAFTVNLADRTADRYAQIGITLEIADPKIGEQIKVFMPAIRNNVLMVIAERSAEELMGRDGKARLAEKVRRETSRALGYEVDDDDDEDEAASAGGAGKTSAPAKPAKKKKKRAAPDLPVRAVHFSNFIIQ